MLTFTRFLAEAADPIRRLKTGLRTTTDPGETKFLLPDGTRLTHGFTSHSTACLKAGTTLNAVLAAGVLRVMPRFGVDGVGGLMTEAQARIIIDDWLLFGEDLQVDVSSADARQVLTSKGWDVPNEEINASTLRAWFNRQRDE